MGLGDSIKWDSSLLAAIIFVLAIFASAVFISIATFMPRSFLINDSLIPRYVIIFSVIGGLMYFFASITGEWMNKIEELNKPPGDPTNLCVFNTKNFWEKLIDFNIERKTLRVIAAPLMAIGIYLLFDLIFFDSNITNITTEQQGTNANLTNLTILEVINAIENTNDNEKIIRLKAGISFLAGAFVKQFFDLIQALADKIGKPQ